MNQLINTIKYFRKIKKKFILIIIFLMLPQITLIIMAFYPLNEIIFGVCLDINKKL